MGGVVRHVDGLIDFYLDTMGESPVGITGELSLVLLLGCLESLAELGRTVPEASKSALSGWVEALKLDCPLNNPLVGPDASVESNEATKHAHLMTIETLRKIGDICRYKGVAPTKRAFAAGIVLMTDATLRTPTYSVYAPLK